MARAPKSGQRKPRTANSTPAVTASSTHAAGGSSTTTKARTSDSSAITRAQRQRGNLHAVRKFWSRFFNVVLGMFCRGQGLGRSTPSHIKRLSRGDSVVLFRRVSEDGCSIRHVTFRDAEQLDQRWVGLSGSIDAAGKSGAQTESGCRHLDVGNGNHRRRRRCALIFRRIGDDDAGSAPGKCGPCPRPTLQRTPPGWPPGRVRVSFPSRSSSSQWSSRRPGEP